VTSSLSKISDIDNFYNDLKKNLELARKALLTTSITSEDDLASDGGVIRSVSEATIVLETMQSITKDLVNLLETYPSLESLFEKNFGDYQDFQDRDGVLETCFVDHYIFPRTENFGLIVDDKFSSEVAIGYRETFKGWCEDTKIHHESTQNLIKTNFNLKLQEKDLECFCIQCLGDYRAKLRDAIYDEQIKLIDSTEEKLHEKVLFKKISELSYDVVNLRKTLEKNINSIRHKFKRSSLNKLENEVKAHFKNKFSANSELGKVYKEKLTAYFNSLLVEAGLKPEMMSPEEFGRFFYQLETNIWKPESFLKVEFDKFTKSILALKRKDISATILKDYLGQFWLHSEARRLNRKIIYHMGPTNSGKTYHSIEALCKAKTGCYLAPLRLLASELYDTMNSKGVKTTLLTGEEVVEVPNCTHYSSTIEMAKLSTEFECAVIDEIQMLTDPQRGWAWTRALIGLIAPEVHICGDHSVLELVKKILSLTGDSLEIKEYKRMTELQVMPKTLVLGELEKGDALITFSRRNALKFKAELENLDFNVSIVYGRLSPEVRREQARKFDEGETDIMVSTDAIAMGMNLPVQRIVFSALSKFVDNKEIPLTFSEVKQISGRAGRFNRFPIGYVTTLSKVDGGLGIIKEAITHELKQNEKGMVGPDIDIYNRVNQALDQNSLPILSLSEFLRLFNTMIFQKPFFCTDLREMIELAEMVEAADEDKALSSSEIFGFACAPVNLGLIDHVQYYVWILNHYVNAESIYPEPIEDDTNDIDYLETAIKCVELYQWLSRHFANKNFVFDQDKLLANKTKAIERLNEVLSEKNTKTCTSCGTRMPLSSRFAICDTCFQSRKKFKPSFSKPSDSGEKSFRPPRRGGGKGTQKKANSSNAAKAYLKHR
jgi:ATP-dependent RNA helicase SUPV3L1/SUV3